MGDGVKLVENFVKLVEEIEELFPPALVEYITSIDFVDLQKWLNGLSHEDIEDLSKNIEELFTIVNKE